jgi:hypothetical protein
MIACAPEHRTKVLFSYGHQAIPVLSLNYLTSALDNSHRADTHFDSGLPVW